MFDWVEVKTFCAGWSSSSKPSVKKGSKELFKTFPFAEAFGGPFTGTEGPKTSPGRVNKKIQSPLSQAGISV